MNPTDKSLLETATLGGGCFWCLEAVFDELIGVQKTTPGYAGGLTPDPTYEEVCTGISGHAEVVQVVFDPQVLPYRDLLQIFFEIHDPTTPNRQGADIGDQYRSIILCHSPRQEKTAHEVVRKLTQEKIITQIVPFQRFYAAEDNHRKYFQRNPSQTYCQVVITPKLDALRKNYKKNVKTLGSKTCPSCGVTFPCNPGNCWCEGLALSGDVRKGLQEKFSGCLCENCLKSRLPKPKRSPLCRKK